MSSSALARRAPSLYRFLQWWQAELCDCVPQSLSRLLRPARQLLIVAQDDQGATLTLRRGAEDRPLGRLAPGVAPVLPRSLRRGTTEVVLRLPADRALAWELKVPRAAADELREALRLHIAHKMPFPAEDLCFDYRLKGAASGKDTLSVAVVAALRADVEEALARARAWGLEPDAVDAVAPDDAERIAPLNLLAGSAQRGSARGASKLRAALVLALVGLTVTAVALPLCRSQAEAEFLKTELRQARVQAEAARKLQEEIDALVAKAGFLALKKQESAPRVLLLNELTRLLQDNTWVAQMTIRERAVTLIGESAVASDLIGLTEGAPPFSAPRFLAPIVQDRVSGLERFTLTFQVAAPGAQTVTETAR